jgi:hypothetical protein
MHTGVYTHVCLFGREAMQWLRWWVVRAAGKVSEPQELRFAKEGKKTLSPAHSTGSALV